MADPQLKPVLNADPIKQALTELEIGEFILTGKVTDISTPQSGDYNYFTIGLKAVDEYSLPPVVQVSQPTNQRPFARNGDVVTIHCRIGGYPRKANGNTYITNTATFLSLIATA